MSRRQPRRTQAYDLPRRQRNRLRSLSLDISGPQEVQKTRYPAVVPKKMEFWASLGWRAKKRTASTKKALENCEGLRDIDREYHLS